MLEVRDLHVKFNNRDREAVAGVSFSIQEGEILGLVGESGSGKTVTAMSIAGLLPRRQCAYSGEILLDGQELLHIQRSQLRKIQGREIGVVFQEPMSAMDPLMKIGLQVEEVLRIHTGLSREERKRLALEALEAVELPDPAGVYGKYPHELSGGMLQRAMIAAATVIRPKLLLLDEPTTALDVITQWYILDILRKIHEESGITMVFCTHDVSIIGSVVDRIAVMYAGQIAEYGKVEDVFLDPAHPYSRGLIKAVPSLRDDISKRTAIPGYPPNLLELEPGCRFAPRCFLKAQGVCDGVSGNLSELIELGDTEQYTLCSHWKKVKELAATD